MRTVKKIDIKNRTYYFYNDIIDPERFKSNLLKIDKKSYKEIGIYHNAYITITKIGDCENIYIVNPLYLRIAYANGYIEEINGNKYLIFDSIDENKGLIKKYNDVFTGIMATIKEVSSEECDYQRDYAKIKFNSGDNLPLNKPLKFYNVTITIRSVFKEDGKLYPQVLLGHTFYDLST